MTLALPPSTLPHHVGASLPLSIQEESLVKPFLDKIQQQTDNLGEALVTLQCLKDEVLRSQIQQVTKQAEDLKKQIENLNEFQTLLEVRLASGNTNHSFSDPDAQKTIGKVVLNLPKFDKHTRWSSTQVNNVILMIRRKKEEFMAALEENMNKAHGYVSEGYQLVSIFKEIIRALGELHRTISHNQRPGG